MTFHQKFDPEKVFDPFADLKLVREFMHEQGSALASAAHLLGGNGASGRVLLLIEALKESRRLTRAHRRQLIDLHNLLSLENVGDPDSLEAALFAEIDPSSPVVEDICLLTDQMTELLRSIAAPIVAPETGPTTVVGDAA